MRFNCNWYSFLIIFMVENYIRHTDYIEFHEIKLHLRQFRKSCV